MQQLDQYRDPGDRRQRAHEKITAMHQLMAHDGYTDRATLQHAWDLSPRRTRATVDVLIERGAICEHELPASRRRLLLYTAAGAAEARAMLDRPVRRTTTGQIGRQLIDHQLAAQRLAVDLARGFFGAGLHELQLRLDFPIGTASTSIQPDLVLWRSSDPDRWLLGEVELSRKSPQRLAIKIANLALHLGNDETRPHAAIYYGPDEVIRGVDRVIDRFADSADPAAAAVVEQNRICTTIDCDSWSLGNLRDAMQW